MTGLFLQFGVYKGNSINRLARLKRKATFYGFDFFVGLPEPIGFAGVGVFQSELRSEQ